MFTQLKLDPLAIAAEARRVSEAVASLSAAGQPGPYAALVISRRLAEHPQAYLEFGPYWWTVKAALRRFGYDLGATGDPLVLQSYGGNLTGLDALAAGELFKDYYRSTFLLGARQFWLDGEGEESYVLADPDMEARMAGGGAAGVKAAAAGRAIPMPAEPEID